MNNDDFEKIVKIKVIPRSKKTEFVGKMDDGSLKIKIKSVPEHGKANQELLDFFENFSWKKWKIQRGATSSRKVLEQISEKL